MNLDEAMLAIARTLDGAGELTEEARAALLDLLRCGRLPGRLPPGEAAALTQWAEDLRGRIEDPVSEIYQEMLQRRIVPTAGGLAIRSDRGAHRKSGAYYTVGPVVRYMLRRAREYHPGARSVIDPACGTGAFLKAAAAAYGSQLDRCVGWDLDPLAAVHCRAQVPSATVQVQDGLLVETEERFDLCLGNPPYISSGLRNAQALAPQRAAALRQRYPHSAAYKLNTYPLFVERGLELLRPGGVLGFILPDSFLTGRYFAALRRLLLRHSLLELTLIRRDFWAHGRVGQSVILFLRKTPPAPHHRVRIRICSGPEELAADEPAAMLPLTEVVWGELDRFRLVSSPELRRQLRQMEEGSLPLHYFLTSYSGLIGRQGQRSLLLAAAEGEAAWRQGLAGRLLRSGREIDRYSLRWEGSWVSLEPSRIKSGGKRSYYTQPKILLRQTADRPRAVLDEEGYYCLNNIHLLVPARPGTSLRSLLGLINSAPLGRYYRAVAMEEGRLYAQVDLDLLGALPIPPLPPAAVAELEQLVRRRENAAPSEAAELDQRIDQRVAALYGLGGDA